MNSSPTLVFRVGHFRTLSLATGLALAVASCSSSRTMWLGNWGQVADEVIHRQHSPYDTSEAAVIVFDIGEMSFNVPDFTLQLKRHVRIQIFKEAGMAEGDIRIPYWHTERVATIQGQTILPDGETIKLKRNQIFDEGDKKGWRQKVFALPGVTSSCIIEYSYILTSPQLAILDPWYFQNESFTELSRISVVVLQGFTYNAYLQNTLSFPGEPSKEIMLDPDRKKRTRYTWERRNLPPIREEPFMTTPKDYIATLNFQLKRYEKRPYLPHIFVQTWKDFNKILDTSYKPFLRPGRRVRSAANKIVEQTEARAAALEVLYRFVRDSIETGEYRGYFGEPIREPLSILRTRKGSRAEKNLLLIALLRGAGVPALPVLISTRPHGRPDQVNPRFDSFDHVLVQSEYRGNEYRGNEILLDTRNAYCPLGMLPSDDLTTEGLLLDADSHRFIEIPAPKSVSALYMKTHSAQLAADGTLRAQVLIRYEGYRNMLHRNRLASSDGAEEFVENYILDEVDNFSIDSVHLGAVDTKEAPLTVELTLTIKHFADNVGDRLYFSPGLFEKFTHNIFQLENRTYPVDYAYPRINHEEIEITLPSGYEIEELPESKSFEIAGHSFIRYVEAQRMHLRYVRRFTINQTIIPAADYRNLRDLYSRIVQADQDQVVLRRSELP